MQVEGESSSGCSSGADKRSNEVGDASEAKITRTDGASKRIERKDPAEHVKRFRLQCVSFAGRREIDEGTMEVIGQYRIRHLRQ